MPDPPIEIVLARQWASCLSLPIAVAGEDESLMYYNEPAEALLGRRFDEAGEMPLSELADIFQITTESGEPIVMGAYPMARALRRRSPAHARGQFRGLDGVQHRAEMTSFPLQGESGRHLGAVALIWEIDDGDPSHPNAGLSFSAGQAGDFELCEEPESLGQQKEMELILTRQWASYLSTPVWLMDGAGCLLYYNRPAEVLLGRTWEEGLDINLEKIPTMFHTTAEDGRPLSADEMPLGKAIKERRPAHGRIGFTSLEGVTTTAEVTAFPVEGQGGRMLGAVAIFWVARGPAAAQRQSGGRGE